METAKDAFKQVEVIRTVTKSPDKICLNRFIIKLLSTYVHIVSLLRCMYILTVFEGGVNKILSILSACNNLYYVLFFLNSCYTAL